MFGTHFVNVLPCPQTAGLPAAHTNDLSRPIVQYLFESLRPHGICHLAHTALVIAAQNAGNRANGSRRGTARQGWVRRGCAAESGGNAVPCVQPDGRLIRQHLPKRFRDDCPDFRSPVGPDGDFHRPGCCDGGKQEDCCRNLQPAPAPGALPGLYRLQVGVPFGAGFRRYPGVRVWPWQGDLLE